MRERTIIGITVAVAVMSLGACASSESQVGRTEPTRTTTSEEPNDDVNEPSTPEEALALGGLELPTDAMDPTVETIDRENYEQSYRVTFTAPRDSSVALCQSIGNYFGNGVYLADDSDHMSALGEGAINTDESASCSAQWTEDFSWSREALIEPGDPAMTRVVISKMGR